jgi:hypothetical protein
MDDLLSIGTGLLRNATDATVAGEKEMADERVYAYSGSRAITCQYLICDYDDKFTRAVTMAVCNSLLDLIFLRVQRNL